MSVVKIRSALEVALNGISPALATAWENSNFTPPAANVPFQAVHILFAEPENVEFGARHNEVGFMQVTLCYPLNAGPLNAATRAELIRSTFYRGATFTNGGVSVIIQRTPEVTPGAIENDRYVIRAKIRFYSYVGY